MRGRGGEAVSHERLMQSTKAVAVAALDVNRTRTSCSELMVVSSIDAAAQPSSVEPPSHQPTNAAILLARTHTSVRYRTTVSITT